MSLEERTTPMNDPTEATCRLHQVVPPEAKDRHAPLLGTCFAFKRPNYFLTAAHCIEKLAVDQLVIAPNDRRNLAVADRVIFHPTADLAILYVEGERSVTGENYFRKIVPPSMGGDYYAYGFPDIDNDKIRPRAFVGNFQNFRDHTSHMKHPETSRPYKYVGGEMSNACPAGQSGGPVFSRDHGDHLFAVVTENYEAGTVEHHEEVSKEGNETYRLEIRRYIMYGMSVVLNDVADWLKANIP